MPIHSVVFDAYGTLFDTQSVATITEEIFPGHGELITQIWRIKQLEYSWLRSLMGRYEDFARLTRDALAYAIRVAGLTTDTATFERIVRKYDHLALFSDVRPALHKLRDNKPAILSNGPLSMLTPVVKNAGLDQILVATISVDAVKVFKPHPEAYRLIETTLGVTPAEVLFVSSNPWDVCGAKAFGLNVAWIERVSPQAMAEACAKSDLVAPLTMFKAIRTQMDELGFAPDYRIASLSELPEIIARIA